MSSLDPTLLKQYEPLKEAANDHIIRAARHVVREQKNRTKITQKEAEKQFRLAIGQYKGTFSNTINNMLADVRRNRSSYTNDWMLLWTTRLLLYVVRTSRLPQELIVWRGVVDPIYNEKETAAKLAQERASIVSHDAQLALREYAQHEFASAEACAGRRKLKKLFKNDDKKLDEAIMHVQQWQIDDNKRESANMDWERRWGSLQPKLQKVGETVVLSRAFMSTTMSRRIAPGFAHHACCLLEIYLPSGFPALGMNEGEFEILLPPCTAFKVLKPRKTQDLGTIYRLRAVGVHMPKPDAVEIGRIMNMNVERYELIEDSVEALQTESKCSSSNLFEVS